MSKTVSDQLAHGVRERELHNHANRVVAVVMWTIAMILCVMAFSYLAWLSIHSGAKGSTSMIVIMGGVFFACIFFSATRAIDDLDILSVNRRVSQRRKH